MATGQISQHSNAEPFGAVLTEAVRTGLLGQLGNGSVFAVVSTAGFSARIFRFEDGGARAYRWTVAPEGLPTDSELARSATSFAADLACEDAALSLSAAALERLARGARHDVL